jgi:hypothetical protein
MRVIIERQPETQAERELWAGKKFLTAALHQRNRSFSGLRSASPDTEEPADLVCQDETGDVVYFQVVELIRAREPADKPRAPRYYTRKEWDAFLPSCIASKVDKHYAKPSHRFILMAYSVDHRVTDTDEGVLQAHSLLARQSLPFDEVWFLTPNSGPGGGNIIQLWPNDELTELGKTAGPNRSAGIMVSFSLIGGRHGTVRARGEDLARSTEALAGASDTLPLTPGSSLEVEE